MGQFTLNAQGDGNVDSVNQVGIFMIILGILTFIGLIVLFAYLGVMPKAAPEEETTEAPATTQAAIAAASGNVVAAQTAAPARPAPAPSPQVIYIAAPAPAIVRPGGAVVRRTTTPQYDDYVEYDVATTRRRRGRPQKKRAHQ